LGQQFFVGPGTWNPQGDFDRVTGHLGSSFWKWIVPRCESAILSTRGTEHAFLVRNFFIGQPIPTFQRPRDGPELLAENSTTEHAEHTEMRAFFFRVFRVFRG
jgi:hypothetical protein